MTRRIYTASAGKNSRSFYHVKMAADRAWQQGGSSSAPVSRGPTMLPDSALIGLSRPSAPMTGARGEATGRVRVLSRSKEGVVPGPFPSGKGAHASCKAWSEQVRDAQCFARRPSPRQPSGSGAKLSQTGRR
jgi:hypothetical protein